MSKHKNNSPTGPNTATVPGTRRGAWLIAGIVTLLALGAVGMYVALGKRDAAPPPVTGTVEGTTEDMHTAVPDAHYVGGESCATCHAREAAAWRGSHHQLAMQAATEQTVRGDFADATFNYADITTRFFKRDGKFFVSTDGPDGKLADFEIKYTFGVTPLQQYLIEFPDGRLQALSIAWDARPQADGGQRWFHLYPDEHIGHDDPLHWTGRQQNWNFLCADCHSTNLRRNYDAARNRFATTWSEINVSCEACHGPGSRHVDWARDPKDKPQDNGLLVHFAEKGNWMIEPGGGTAQRTTPRQSQAELETCAVCHTRRAQFAEGHVPGRSLHDSYFASLLEPGLYEADGQMRDEVYNYGSFLQSKMHAKGVSCGDCHEPHSLKLRADGDGVCLQCHAAQAYAQPAHHRHALNTPASRCVACHMPARTYMVIDPRHDHSFRVPRPDLSVEFGTPNACNDCHRDQSAQWAAAAIENWHGPARKGFQNFAPALVAARAERLDAAQLLRAIATDPAQPAIARATAAAALAPYLTTVIATELQWQLMDADPLVRLGALRGLEGLAVEPRWSVAGKLLHDPVRGVRIEAASFLADSPVAQLGAADRELLERALDEYIAAQTVNADRPEAQLNLGNLYARRADPAQAEQAYRAAIRLDPGFIPAYVNLADLYRALGRDSEGERILQEALAHAPDAAAVHYALGLRRVRDQKLPEALTALARAATLDPAQARYAYVHAIALDSMGQREEAMRVLDASHQRHPADRDTLTALVSFAQQNGDRDATLRYARQLHQLTPDDAGLGQLISTLQEQ